MSERYHLGLDVGSISLKTVLLADDRGIVFEDYTRTRGQPYDTALEVLGRLIEAYPREKIATVSVTGMGGKLLADLLGGVFVNEVIAQTRATSEYAPQARSIIDMGGEDSKLILVHREGEGHLSISDFAMNSMCAAGTGSFLDQQAHRLGYTIERFGREALRSSVPPRIAGRCSVFAKSDMIHLQQGATPDYEIIAGLCHAMIRNLKSNIAKGKKITPPVSFQGGVAANQGVRKALVEVMELGPGELVVPEHFFTMGAIGAAMHALDQFEAGKAEAGGLAGLDRLRHYLDHEKPAAKRFNPLPAPSCRPNPVHRSLDGLDPEEKLEVYLGIDVGSISTNVVLIDSDHNVVDREYLMTAGRPLEAIKQGLRAVGGRVGDRVKVVGAGTTGSGRYLTGDFIGADIVRNEITAQATAAAAIDPEVDTIFEIGGQDSKYISLDNGAIVDFMMNKVCAAGTGSFLEEQAEKLGIDIKGQFGDIALSSPAPVQMGERCTVFMESDLVHYQQQGVDLPDLVGGLCYSIVTNYLNKVVEDRRVGRRIFYQGATAFNQGIVAAFEQVTGQKITVPDHADVTGAIGVAILAHRERSWTESGFKGFDLSERKYEISSFECNGCANTCEIRKVTVEGETPLFYGSRCDKYDVLKKKAAASDIPDLFTERTEWLLNPPEAQPLDGQPRGVIGLPRVMFFHELMPFFKTFWTALGFETVVSEKSNKKLIHRGCEVVVSEPCFPTKVGHGHILDLIDQGVKRIFLPSVINMQQKDPELKHGSVCPYSQTLTYTVNAAIDFKSMDAELIRGPVYFGYGEKVLTKCLTDLVEPLGVKAGEVKKAVKLAREAQENFYQRLLARGREILPTLGPNRLGMVVVARPYNGFDPGLNLNLSAKLRDLGVVGIPMDFMPLDDPNYHTEAKHQYWRYGQKILSAAEIIRQDPRLYAIFITNFGCGPDSFILHFFRDLMRGKPYLEIEIDEHSSDVGAVTRLEAFLDSLKNVKVPEESQSLLTYRGRHKLENKRKVYIPPMTDHAEAVASVFRAFNVQAEVLPPSDGETLLLGRKITSGKECYPCILTTGDLAKLTRRPDFDPDKSAFFMPSAYGPCRFGQYHRFQRLALDQMGFPQVPIYSPDQSDEMYEELDLAGGGDLTRIAWRGIVAVDLLQKALFQTRPYEINRGQTEAVYRECLADVCRTLETKGDMGRCLKRCRARQEQVEVKDPGSRPTVGVVGEIYVRNNDYSNENALRAIESFGGEVMLPPFTEWMLYTNETNLAEAKLNGRWKQIAGFKITHHFQEKDLHELEGVYRGFLRNFHEPPIQATYEYAAPYLHHSFEGEAILSIGKCKDFLLKGASGLVNIMPFTCMPGTIVTALIKRFREDHDNIPFLNLSYDGQEQTNTLTRLEAFMYQVYQHFQDRRKDKANRRG
ncbi:MAG: acyl-CoA dehydratase activase [Thermodesulfobacteriota bacterium]